MKIPSLVLAALVLALSYPSVTTAQYMFLDTNGDGVSTLDDQVSESGPTTLDVWIRTDQNRDGSAASCVTEDGDLTINSYEFILQATGGTVSWSNFVNHQPDFTVSMGHAESATDYHNGQGGGTILPPGTYRLASVTVNVTTGTPAIQFATTTSLSGGYFTSFGSRCSGTDFDNTLKLGTDWFDADGASYAGMQNAAPVLTPPSNMTLAEGTVAEQDLTATDFEGNPITFDLVSGPFYATVTTVDPGTGTGLGRIRLTPGFQAAGPATATVRASDAFLADTESFEILVADVNTAPVLSAIQDQTLTEGQYRDFLVTATDAELDPLVFSLGPAPAYVRINAVTASGVARISLFPGHADAGEADATVQASDGLLTGSETFHIVVNEAVPVHNQILCQPSDMLVPQGTASEQPLHAVSPDGDPVQFLLVSGPSYVTVSTISSDPSSATGLVRAAPGGTEIGTATVQVAATDGIATDTRSFQISVGDPATLPDPEKPLFVGVNHTFATGRTPQSVAAGDLDGDGALDLVTANLSGSVTILRGLGDGRFDRRDDYPLPEEPYSVAIGDLNGDGRPDLAVADSARDVISVLYAIGQCQYGRRLDVGTPLRPAHVKLADWTEDGVLDMVVSDEGADMISMIRGRGDGTFHPEQHFPVGSDPCYSDEGDFNRDGHLDVVVANESSNSVSVLLGNGDGTFQPQAAYQVGADPRSVEVGDLDGDGILDLAAANFESYTVSVLLGNGDGTFRTHTQYPCGRTPWSLAIGDLNGDSVLDIVTANVGDNTTTVLFGTAGGAFLAPVAHPAEDGPAVIGSGDWNQDGIQDLVVGSRSPETGMGALRVQLGAGGGAFTPGQMLTGFTPTEVVTDDWDGDHVPDLAVGCADPAGFQVLKGVGDGTFQPPVHYPFRSLGGIVSAELTGDGHTDLAILSPSLGIALFGNDGTGTFAFLEGDTITVGGSSLIGGDWNGDGRTDLAVAEPVSGMVHVFLGSADGSFTRMPPVSTPWPPRSLAAGDFNKDQRLDLAVNTSRQLNTFPFNTVESRVEILTGLGDGTFGGASRPLDGGGGIHVVDANGDGNADLAVSSGFMVSLFLGFGTGDFALKREFGSGGAYLVEADLSGDGRVDLAIPEYGMDRVEIWINQGTFPVVSNRAPVADAGGPYTGAVGAPVAFDGTGSSDPDGDTLAMTWGFGDGASGSGSEPSHTYQVAGAFTVTLTVSDGRASDQATTSATIGSTAEARVFTVPEDGAFRLFAGKPIRCVRLEPVDEFDLSQVDLESVRLRSVGTGTVDEIGAVADKNTPLVDRDRNGVVELNVCFAIEDLRLLFASVRGTRDVPVSLEGSLLDGRAFRGETTLHVIGAMGFPAAFAAPNPMNPAATLFVATSRPGRLRVSLYDASGRRVRLIADRPAVAAGVHELRFDGRSDQGTDLSSGIYFYRVESSEGTTSGRVTVVR